MCSFEERSIAYSSSCSVKVVLVLIEVVAVFLLSPILLIFCINGAAFDLRVCIDIEPISKVKCKGHIKSL